MQIFDSMFNNLPTMGKAQIAALLATEEQMVTAKFMEVQLQCGGRDCGLFSISFTTALVFGEQPGHSIFDQKKMRSHLMHCFEQKQFPIRKRRHIHSKVRKIQFTVCAACRNCWTQNGLTVRIVKNGITQIHVLKLQPTICLKRVCGIAQNAM